MDWKSVLKKIKIQPKQEKRPPVKVYIRNKRVKIRIAKRTYQEYERELA